MDWQEIIRQAFFKAWQQNSGVDITDYVYRISNHFNLSKIEQHIVSSLSHKNASEEEFAKQVRRLEKIAALFVAALLEASDDGKTINAPSIIKAKHIILEQAGCPEEDF
jgi:hypothetical protein